jgi:hypothetical protein
MHTLINISHSRNETLILKSLQTLATVRATSVCAVDHAIKCRLSWRHYYTVRGSIDFTDMAAEWPTKTREIHNHHFDSTIWNEFDFRDDDIVIATYAKCESIRTASLLVHTLT